MNLITSARPSSHVRQAYSLRRSPPPAFAIPPQTASSASAAMGNALPQPATSPARWAELICVAGGANPCGRQRSPAPPSGALAGLAPPPSAGRSSATAAAGSRSHMWELSATFQPVLLYGPRRLDHGHSRVQLLPTATGLAHRCHAHGSYTRHWVLPAPRGGARLLRPLTAPAHTATNSVRGNSTSM